jgi:carbonic anhydrase/acetyltransferase-like protein (isoleucine patch superfamily)
VATVVEFEGRWPRVADDAWLAPTATVIGDVEIATGASIWFGAVLRGDVGRIRIGAGSCVQDNAVLHCAADLPTVVGENVTVGHLAMLEGCVVEDAAQQYHALLRRYRTGARVREP